jgi:predicted nucleic acid-binding protein
MVFVDSDALIALRVNKDLHFSAAKKILKELKERNEILATSWQVIDEVTTKLSFFTTKAEALWFLQWAVKTNLQIVYVDDSLAGKIINKFKQQRSKRVSLTDCTNMVIAKKMGVKTFFSFDKHYQQNGFELLG